MKKWIVLAWLTVLTPLYAQNVPYLKLFKESAKQYDVPVSALLAIAKNTTNFNPDYSVPKLCGITAYDATSLVFLDENVDCFDPKTNIDLAAKEFKKWLDRYDGDVLETLKKHRDPSYEEKLEKGFVTEDYKERTESWCRNIEMSYMLYKVYDE